MAAKKTDYLAVIDATVRLVPDQVHCPSHGAGQAENADIEAAEQVKWTVTRHDGTHHVHFAPTDAGMSEQFRPLVEAIKTGHAGIWTSLHQNSPAEALADFKANIRRQSKGWRRHVRRRKAHARAS